MTEIISVCAIICSIVTFIIVFRRDKYVMSQNIELQRAIFYMERNVHFEGRLAEWPEAFRLLGINLDEVKADGISKEEITFLILSVNSLASIASIKNISVYEEIKNNSYRKRMFTQKATHKAWKYARRFYGESYQGIDKYLKEEYGLEYEPLE